MARSSLSCFNCNKEVSYKSKFCSECGQYLKQQTKHERNVQVQKPKLNYISFHSIGIQKTSSWKYFVNWKFNASEGEDHSYFEEGKSCYSAEKMPEFLTEHQECWENNDWSGWEKELKDNHLLVKSKEWGENGKFKHLTQYKFNPQEEADREEREAEQRKEECKERAKKWKEEHKNKWRNCSKCGKIFCLETEGSINESTARTDGGEPVEKTEYFCGKCSSR